MKSFAAVAALAAVGVSATPLAKRAAITDVQILNYALTLEHLEATFYAQGLQKLGQAAFNASGADYGWFNQIAQQEATHVSFLTSALGKQATAACTYSFPYTDVPSFIALANVLESVGVSAYLGAAQYITTPAYLTAAAAILTDEARHQAYLAYSLGDASWSGAFDTPQDFDQIYSLAAPFITACPSSNPPLPVQAFPKLAATVSGSNIQFNFTKPTNGSGTYYAAIYSGLTANVTQISSSNSIPKPAGVNGTAWVVITNSPSTNITDANTIAGPAYLNLGGLAVVGGNNGSGVVAGGNGSTDGSSTPPTGGSGSGSGGSGGSNGALSLGARSLSVVAGALVAGVFTVLF